MKRLVKAGKQLFLQQFLQETGRSPFWSGCYTTKSQVLETAGSEASSDSNTTTPSG